MDICLANTWDFHETWRQLPWDCCCLVVEQSISLTTWVEKKTLVCCCWFLPLDNFDGFFACSCHMHNISIPFQLFQLFFPISNYVNFDKWCPDISQRCDWWWVRWVGFFVVQLKRSLGLFVHRCLGKLFFHLNAITHWNPLPHPNRSRAKRLKLYPS